MWHERKKLCGVNATCYFGGEKHAVRMLNLPEQYIEQINIKKHKKKQKDMLKPANKNG